MTRRQARPQTSVDDASPARRLPSFAIVVRDLDTGLHPYLALLPKAVESPAMTRILDHGPAPATFLREVRVRISAERGYAHVDDEAREIVLAEGYYREGSALDLYLDLLHELTHIRQLSQGHDLWNESFAYHDRPTEVEGYAVAVEEGRRLGFTEAAVLEHLKNPWMSRAEVRRLLGHIDAFLGGGPLPHAAEALRGAPFVVRHPWRCPRAGTDSVRPAAEGQRRCLQVAPR